MSMSPVFETIKKHLPELEVRYNEPMKNHTSFKIGGAVQAMCFPKSQNEITGLCQILHESGVKPLILGNGTNLLAEDGRLDIFAVKTHSGLNAMKLSGDTEITADCGVLLSKLAVFALEHGLKGLEFAHGIPGTLGGAVTMNAGAYGGEMKDVVKRTKALDSGASVFDTKAEAHEFSYRHSRFSDSEAVLLSSVLNLTKGEPKEIKFRMDELSKKRRESQPLNLPSAGSTFKRPQTGFAAAMIEQAGLKGYTVGGAKVSEKHAGFVVNTGGATFSDVVSVMDHIQETVFKQFGITLEPEVKIIRSNGL